MMWWIKDPKRLADERRAIAAIDEDWFENPRLVFGQSGSTEAALRYCVTTSSVPARDDLSQHLPRFAAKRSSSRRPRTDLISSIRARRRVVPVNSK